MQPLSSMIAAAGIANARMMLFTFKFLVDRSARPCFEGKPPVGGTGRSTGPAWFELSTFIVVCAA
jgi:hypothetical protein